MVERHRGTTLIELAVVISALSALILVAVGLIHTLLTMQWASTDRLRTDRALDRLAEQFLDDVHAARQFRSIEKSLEPGKQPGWEFLFDGNRKVEYRDVEEQVVRIEREADRVVRRESFALFPGATASIAPPGPQDPKLLQLRITSPPPEAEGSPTPPVRIDAALGIDHRFTPSKEPQK